LTGRIIGGNVNSGSSDRTNMLFVRHGSHRVGSPQNGLRDEQTCGITLASAYVLCHLSAT